MAYNKCECKDNETVITAQMMNDIQDAICGAEQDIHDLKGGQQTLEEHVANKNNPHGVTAEQIGAAPAGYGIGSSAKSIGDANDAIVGGIYYYGSTASNIPDGFGNGVIFVQNRADAQIFQRITDIYGLAAERIRQSNGTWGSWIYCGPSAFAPSGYGLGTVGADVSDANHVFDVFRNGWFRTFSTTANTAVAHGAGIALVYDANRALHLLAKTTAGTMRTRYTPNSDGVFVEDLINPPMTAGYEYRTIERWNGKTVYTKLVSVGALGAGSSTTKSLGTNGVKIIDFDAIGYTTSGSCIKFPRVDSSGNITARCWVQNDTIWIGTIADNTDVTECYVTIKYVKD
jgi:hypothetical protein